MFSIRNISVLIKKEFTTEWKQKFALNGLLLYLLSTILIVYISFIQVEPITWITLYWIIILFSAVSAVAKSFMQESRWRMLYYYTMVNPVELIVSKMIYNMLLMIFLSLTGLLFYSIVTGSPVVHLFYFILAVVLGSSSFSLTFTLMSAIAGKAGNNTTLMSILSFPLIIPVLLLLIKISLASIQTSMNIPVQDFLLLGGLNFVMLLMAVILFPYLWHD